MTLRRHPLALLRDALAKRGVIPNQELWELPDGRSVTAAGLVITRQRPGSASGVTFVTMEDETGYVNLIVWKRVADAQRAALLESRLLLVRGTSVSWIDPWRRLVRCRIPFGTGLECRRRAKTRSRLRTIPGCT